MPRARAEYEAFLKEMEAEERRENSKTLQDRVGLEATI